jgi:hypothetical protein
LVLELLELVAVVLTPAHPTDRRRLPRTKITEMEIFLISSARLKADLLAPASYAPGTYLVTRYRKFKG